MADGAGNDVDALRQSIMRAQLAKPLPNSAQPAGTKPRDTQSHTTLRGTGSGRTLKKPRPRIPETLALGVRVATLDKKIDRLIDMLRGPGDDRSPSPRLLPVDIRRVVTAFFDVTEEELDSRSRSSDIARIRQIAFYLCRTRTGQSLPEIGRAFYRDHSTILHGVRRIAALRKTDAALHDELSTLEERLADLLVRRITA